MLCSLVLVSSIRCLLLDDPGFQLERDDLIVAHVPHLAAAIPLPPRLFHPVPHFHLGKAHAYPHNRFSRKTRRWRVPIALRDNELHGFEPLLPLRIVAIARTDETVALRREQLFRTFLTRFEMEESLHHAKKVPNLPG